MKKPQQTPKRSALTCGKLGANIFSRISLSNSLYSSTILSQASVSASICLLRSKLYFSLSFPFCLISSSCISKPFRNSHGGSWTKILAAAGDASSSTAALRSSTTKLPSVERRWWWRNWRIGSEWVRGKEEQEKRSAEEGGEVGIKRKWRVRWGLLRLMM